VHLRKQKLFVELVNLPTSALLLQLIPPPQKISFLHMKVRKPTESTTTENEDTEKLRLKNQVPADHNISSIQIVKHIQSQL